MLYKNYLCSDASQFTVSGPHRIGRVYRKVLYREFTDGTFTEEIPHPTYLGLLGPIIKGEVGDTLKVHFKNMADRPYTMHPHGVFYDKGSEGAFYDDHTKGDLKGDDHVQPNMNRVYEWTIPKNHAPTKDDENCLTWAYHSHVKPVQDINTGLIGEYNKIGNKLKWNNNKIATTTAIKYGDNVSTDKKIAQQRKQH